MRPFRIQTAKLVVVIPLLALTSPLLAENILDANVVTISSDKTYGEIVFIKTDKSKSAPPGCHANLSWDYVMPLTSEHDKKLYALLLSARVSQIPITLVGTGSCDHFGSIESLQGIHW